MEDKDLLQQEIAKLTKNGWQIVSQGDDNAQLKLPKRWNKVLLIIGFVSLFIYGIGLLFLIWAGIDFALRQDELIYLTINDIKASRPSLNRTSRRYKMPQFSIGAIIFYIIAIVIVVLAVYFGYIG